MRLLILSFVICWIAMLGQAQTNNIPNKKLIDAFESETADKAFFRSKGIKRTFKSFAIPEDFLNAISGNPTMVFGVSDAMEDTTFAFKQAIWRAGLQAASKEYSTLRWGGDFFMKERANATVANKNIIFASLFSKKAPIASLKQLYSFRTHYNETVVVASVKSYTDRFMHYNTELFMNVTAAGNNRSVLNRLETVSGLGGDVHIDSLLYKTDNKTFHLSSSFYDKRTPHIQHVRKYHQVNEEECTSDQLLLRGFSKCTMLHGLWPAYLNALMREVAEVPKGRVKTKRVDQIYNKTATSLGRDVTSMPIRYSIDSMLILDNELYLKLDFN